MGARPLPLSTDDCAVLFSLSDEVELAGDIEA